MVRNSIDMVLNLKRKDKKNLLYYSILIFQNVVWFLDYVSKKMGSSQECVKRGRFGAVYTCNIQHTQ